MGRQSDLGSSTQRVIDELVTLPSGLSASEVTRRTGISRATLHRIAAGTVKPSLQTLQELAIVQGKDLDIRLKPLSDPDAAAAARLIIEGELGDWSGDDAIERWGERLNRIAESTDGGYLTILQSAGWASSLLHREGTALLRGDSGALRLASAGDASGGSWVVSGRAALEAAPDHRVHGPSILWVDDVERAASALSETHKPVSSALNAQVIVAEANPAVYLGAYTAGAVRYVAPIQMLLDCVGLGGEQEEVAMGIAQGWST